jgi:hypothetical protein
VVIKFESKLKPETASANPRKSKNTEVGIVALNSFSFLVN